MNPDLRGIWLTRGGVQARVEQWDAKWSMFTGHLIPIGAPPVPKHWDRDGNCLASSHWDLTERLDGPIKHLET